MPNSPTSDCTVLDPLVTPYVDGELAPAERQALEEHVRRCAPCRSRVAAEEAVHRLLDERRLSLCAERAPAVLSARCAELARQASRPAPTASPTPNRLAARLAPFAVAAALVLIVGGAFLYQLTERSSRVMAAELTADHVKCFILNGALGTARSASEVERAMAAKFGWQARLPEEPARAGLELVGERTCLYGEGRIAHIMYRHEGKPVSLFMLPRDMRKEEVVGALGHQASIWSVGDRAFVLVAREPRADVERMSSFVRAGLR
jgi:anti-sigma factor RsiW